MFGNKIRSISRCFYSNRAIQISGGIKSQLIALPMIASEEYTVSLAREGFNIKSFNVERLPANSGICFEIQEREQLTTALILTAKPNIDLSTFHMNLNLVRYPSVLQMMHEEELIVKHSISFSKDGKVLIRKDGFEKL